MNIYVEGNNDSDLLKAIKEKFNCKKVKVIKAGTKSKVLKRDGILVVDKDNVELPVNNAEQICKDLGITLYYAPKKWIIEIENNIEEWFDKVADRESKKLLNIKSINPKYIKRLGATNGKKFQSYLIKIISQPKVDKVISSIIKKVCTAQR